MKKVVIAGGTGFIGSYLSKRFEESGYKVLIVSRQEGHVSWLPADLKNAVDGAELVVNLAGKSINCRHTKANKRALLESRIHTTLLIGKAIECAENPPKLWINASASGVYKPSKEMPMTEINYLIANDFLSELVQQWEKVFFDFQLSKTRRIALRTSVVLGKNDGALQPLLRLTRLGFGGKLADGNQMFSWIHIEDYFQVILFLLENPLMTGVCNCTSPSPLRNAQLMKSIRETLRIPFGIPAPAFAVTFGAAIVGIEPSLILNSSYLLPKYLIDNGFKFRFPQIEEALDQLVNFEN